MYSAFSPSRFMAKPRTGMLKANVAAADALADPELTGVAA